MAYGIVDDGMTAQECENGSYLQARRRILPHEPREYLYAFLARITRHIALNCCRERNSLKRRALIGELTAELESEVTIPTPIRCGLSCGGILR